MNMPLTANSTGESIMMRVRSTASDVSCACWPVSSPRPGAVSGTSSGASSSPRIAKNSVAANSEVQHAGRQAPAPRARPDPRTMRANVGMNALPSVAPASSWKIRSGRRNATK